MKIYLVGGAVRDELLNQPVKEKDWVVVGATPDEMLSKGFYPVGKDFPVFLHPSTKEEYALARTERKMGRGYTGFQFNADPSITLIEDLKRRDLTINAMAKTEEGTLIDPYGGQEDLKNHILRHVSEAFIEDPVRILRIARFAARLNFKIADETLALMKTMVESGEIDALVPERVWKEFERALKEPYPEHFFATLAACGALAKLFPEMDYPGAGMTALKKSKFISSNGIVRFAALLHPLTNTKLTQFAQKYRIPRDYVELAQIVSITKTSYGIIFTLTPDAILDFFIKTDAFRREKRFLDILCALEACQDESFTPFWLDCYEFVKSLPIHSLITGLPKNQIANQIENARIKLIKEWLTRFLKKRS